MFERCNWHGFELHPKDKEVTGFSGLGVGVLGMRIQGCKARFRVQ